ncbi:MAG: preprotein translocase subunit SecE [Mycoplasma sp.]
MNTSTVDKKTMQEKYDRARAEKKDKKKQLKLKKIAAKNKLKVEIKSWRDDLSNESENHKQRISELNKTDENYEKIKLDIIVEHNDKKIEIKNKIIQAKFNYRKQFKTASWILFKWTYGINKEFVRIIWSSPRNTFKYLGIIIVVISILALLFFGIDALITLF